MLVLLLLVLMSSSALSDTGLPFRLVSRGACVPVALTAADLGCIPSGLLTHQRCLTGHLAHALENYMRYQLLPSCAQPLAQLQIALLHGLWALRHHV